MIIKQFEKFILFLEKDSKMYEYGCLMVHLNIPGWFDFVKSLNIQESDLYDSSNPRYGIETEPHCTILYGIHQDVEDSDVEELFQGLTTQEFDIQVEGIDCFYNKDYDVLKMNVKSNKLNELNSLAKSLPYTSQYADYKPHITLAYLQKGKGNQFVNPTFSERIDSIDKIVYSKPNGQKIDIPVVRTSKS